LRHLQRQIEELYGPLLGLIQDGRVVYEVAMNRLKRADGTMDFRTLSDEEMKLWLFFNNTYLLPTNRKMAKLLREKAFLLDSLEPPRSVTHFCTHAIQYELVNTVWQSTGVDATFIDHIHFPKELNTTSRLHLMTSDVGTRTTYSV